MLPINSANEVVPGGPVSSVTKLKKILGGARTTKLANTRLIGTRSTIARVTVFAKVGTTARKILQQG